LASFLVRERLDGLTNKKVPYLDVSIQVKNYHLSLVVEESLGNDGFRSDLVFDKRSFVEGNVG
ncbi:hypothetical protein, partial [Salmonella enterica]|uniref:hypothetical protein n=1 Tax=Salmonella enterica TaxID=28901 RepID=UPI0019D69025